MKIKLYEHPHFGLAVNKAFVDGVPIYPKEVVDVPDKDAETLIELGHCVKTDDDATRLLNESPVTADGWILPSMLDAQEQRQATQDAREEALAAEAEEQSKDDEIAQLKAELAALQKPKRTRRTKAEMEAAKNE